MAALFLGGLVVGGLVGAVPLLVLAGFVAWLAFLAWPILTPGQRMMRWALSLVLIGLAVAQAGLL